MKTLAILVVVMSMNYNNAMELLAPLTPSKKLIPQSPMSPRKKARPSPVEEYPKVLDTMDVPELTVKVKPGVYTPTSTKVRVNLLKAMVEAIYGRNVAQPFIADLKNDQERLQASPKTFGKRCRSTFRALFIDDLEQMGLNEQDIKSQLIPARKSIEEDAADLKDLPASSKEVRVIGRKLAQEVGCPNLLFRNRTNPEDYAEIVGNVVVLNEEEVNPAHLTEQELSWLIAHEIEHYANDDHKEAMAYFLAFKAHAAKLKRLSGTQKDEDRKSSKVSSEQLKGHVSRTHEVFADVGPALRRPDLAAGYEKIVKSWIEEEDSDEEDVQTHPSYKARLKLARATRAFHQQHAKEQSRMAAASPLTLKTAKRSLAAEFDQSEREEIA